MNKEKLMIQLLSIIKFLQAKTIKAGPNCLSYTMTRLFDYDATLCIKVNYKVFFLFVFESTSPTWKMPLIVEEMVCASHADLLLIRLKNLKIFVLQH